MIEGLHPAYMFDCSGRLLGGLEFGGLEFVCWGSGFETPL